MKSSTLKTASEQEFFKRGKTLARLADKKRKLPAQHTISFEDPEDLLRLLTISRLSVLRAVKSEPGSISDIAARLQRDRSAVKRDLDQLAQVGLIEFETKPLAGHGLMKEVRVTAQSFKLEALVA